jgi:hypothetical protein
MLSLGPKLFAVLLGFALAAAPAMAEDAVKKKRVKHKKAVAEQSSQYRGADKFRTGPLYYNGGEYLGDDPDPNIRFQLWRDLGSRFGGDP